MKITVIIVALVLSELALASGPPPADTEVTPPSIIRKVEPEYTAQARTKRLEGVIKLSVEITSEGNPVDIQVLKPLDPGLDAKAVESVRQWRFRPASKDGKPVRMTAIIDVDFRLPRYPLLKGAAPLPDAPPAEEDFWRIILP